MSAFASLEDLEEHFWSQETLDAQVIAAKELANRYPTASWDILKKGLRHGRLRASVAGLLVLDDDRVGGTLLKTIQSRGGSDEDIEVLMNALGVLGDVTSLRHFVEDPFAVPRLQLPALRALSDLPSKEGSELFLRELHASSRVRQELAIVTLGEWRVKEAVPLLCKRVRNQLYTSLRNPIVSALAKIGTPDAVAGLRELILHEGAEIRLETAEQIALFAHPEWLSLLQACLETFAEDEVGASRVRLAIATHEEVMASFHRERVEPLVDEMESVLW